MENGIKQIGGFGGLIATPFGGGMGAVCPRALALLDLGRSPLRH